MSAKLGHSLSQPPKFETHQDKPENFEKTGQNQTTTLHQGSFQLSVIRSQNNERNSSFVSKSPRSISIPSKLGLINQGSRTASAYRASLEGLKNKNTLTSDILTKPGSRIGLKSDDPFVAHNMSALEIAGEFEDEEEEFEKLQETLLKMSTDEPQSLEASIPKPREKNYLTVFESLALSSILEEVYLQLEILGSSFPGQIAIPEKTDFLTYDERFSQEVEEHDVEYMARLKNFKNPFLVDEAEIGTAEERHANKLQKDRAFLQELLRLTKIEIDECRTFETLKENVAREDGRRNEEITLMQREKRALQAVSRMRRRIVEFQDEIKREENKRLEMINHLKDQLHEAKQQGKQDSRYTRAWYEARNAHNFSELSHRTHIAKLRIKALEVDMTRDKLAHQNIQAWYTLVFEETETKIAQWKNKYDEDLEIIDKKIREQQDIIRAQQTLMESLRNTIAERMVELGPWEEEKQAERMAKANNMRVHNAAKKIQRWWRKYMTVHNLYKKKKVKGGKGKKGKKKPKSKDSF